MFELMSMAAGAVVLSVGSSLLGGHVAPTLLHPFSVSESVEHRGYTGEVMNALVMKEIRRLELTAGAEFAVGSLSGAESEPLMDLEVTEFSLMQVSNAVFRRLGYIRFEFEGAVVERNGGIELHLFGHTDEGRTLDATFRANAEDPYALASQAARFILVTVEPYNRARLQFEADQQAGDFTRTLAIIDELQYRLPPAQHPYLYTLAGRAHQIAGRTGEAVAMFDRAIALDPAYAQPYAYLAMLYADNGAPAKAETYRERALATDPTLPDSFRRWARMYSDAQLNLNCVNNFERLEALVALDPRDLLEYGACLKAAGLAEKAEETVSRAAELDDQARILKIH